MNTNPLAIFGVPHDFFCPLPRVKHVGQIIRVEYG